MKSIRLHFVLGDALSSRLIAWYGQGYGGFSHVDAILSDGSLAGARSDRVGGKPPGFQIRPPDYEKWRHQVTVEIPTDAATAASWERWLRKKVGAQYDRAAILGFLVGQQMHKTGYWICSAAQWEALVTHKFLNKGVTPASQITPNSLFLLVTDGIGGKVTMDTFT